MCITLKMRKKCCNTKPSAYYFYVKKKIFNVSLSISLNALALHA